MADAIPAPNTDWTKGLLSSLTKTAGMPLGAASMLPNLGDHSSASQTFRDLYQKTTSGQNTLGGGDFAVTFGNDSPVKTGDKKAPSFGGDATPSGGMIASIMSYTPWALAGLVALVIAKKVMK